MVFRSKPRRRPAAFNPCVLAYSIATSRCFTFQRCRGAMFNSLHDGTFSITSPPQEPDITAPAGGPVLTWSFHHQAIDEPIRIESGLYDDGPQPLAIGRQHPLNLLQIISQPMPVQQHPAASFTATNCCWNADRPRRILRSSSRLLSTGCGVGSVKPNLTTCG